MKKRLLALFALVVLMFVITSLLISCIGRDGGENDIGSTETESEDTDENEGENADGDQESDTDTDDEILTPNPSDPVGYDKNWGLENF